MMKNSKLIQEELNNPAIQEIKAAMHANKDLRMHERYQTILLKLRGVSNNDISAITGRSLSTVYNYINAYRKDGIEGLNRDYQALSRVWFAKGQQKIVPTYGKHHGAKLIGSLDYETGEVFCTQEIQYTAKEFLSFLERLMEKYPNQKIVMVLDNARESGDEIRNSSINFLSLYPTKGK
jgi:transposase